MPRKKKELNLSKATGKGYEFLESQHIHLLDGKPLTGVTTILQVIAKPALIQWAATMAVDYISEKIVNCFDDFMVVPPANRHFNFDKFDEILKEARTAHRKKKEEAGTAGTDVHGIIEGIVKNAIHTTQGMIDVNVLMNQPLPQVRNFVEWAVREKIKFLESELHCWDKDLWVGGICDFVYEKDGKIYVGDVKTGSGIYKEYFLQVAAYQYCLRDKYPVVEGRTIVNIKKDGNIDVEIRTGAVEFESSFNAFKNALALHRYFN